MSNVVGSVLITLDIQDRASAGYVRAANTVARQGRHLTAATVAHNKSMSDAFTRTAAAVSVLHGPLGGVASRIASIGTLARHSSIGMASLALAAGGAGFALTGFLKIADRMRLMENQMKTVTTGTANLRDMQQELLNVSQRSRASMDASVTIYARTARATEHLSLSQEKLLRITETVQKAFAIGGASTAEAQGAAIQLSQGIASDRFSGDEFRSVAENAPVLLREMANSLGVNIGKLREMAHAGQLTADVVTKSILDASKEIDRYFDMTEMTIGQSWAKLRNEVDMYVHEMDTAYGITRLVAAGMNAFAENIGSVTDNLLKAAAAMAAFAGGRAGASLLGRGGKDASGLRNTFQQLSTHGLFYGTRKAAKDEADAARGYMEQIKKDRAKAAAEIADIEGKSHQRLVDMRMAHERKLTSAREQAAIQNRNLNSLTERRVALTGSLATAQANVVQQLRLERQEALKAVQVAGAHVGGAARRYSLSGSKGDLRALEKEQRRLAVAQENYRKSTERLTIAQSGAFDDARIRKYGVEVRKIEKQIKSNAAAIVDAQRRFVAADAAYVAAQRQGGVYLQAANIERYKSLRLVADLENKQHDLNRAYTAAGVRLQQATRQMTLLGAAQMRLMSFGSGVWSLLGGGPGVAIMGAIAAFGMMSKSAYETSQRTKALNAEMRELGFLAEEAADAADKIGGAKVEGLKLGLREINDELELFLEGQGLVEKFFNFDKSNLGNIAQQVKDIGDNVFNWGATRNSAREVEKIIQKLQQGTIAANDANAALDAIAKRDVSADLLEEIANLRLAIDRNEALLKLRAKRRADAGSYGEGQALADDMKKAQAAIDDARKSLQALFSHRAQSGLIDSQAMAELNHLEWQLAAGLVTAEDFYAKVQEILNNHPGNRSALSAMADQVQSLVDRFKDATSEMRRFMSESQAMGGVGDPRNIPERYWRSTSRDQYEAASKEFRKASADAAKKGLRDLIGLYEGTDRGRGYNETLDYGRWTGGPVNLTQMTLREVRALQDKMRTPENRALYGNGKGSSAVGRYQIVSSTLDDLINSLGLSRDERFTPELQDRLADELIRRRGRNAEGLRNEWEGLRRAPDALIGAAYDKSSLDLGNLDPEVLKRLEGLKNLRLDALAGQMDEFNQKIVQQAQALGVSREEIEQYIRAVTTGDLQNVPKIFHEIALAMDEAANNELIRNLKDMQNERSVKFLSDVDQELVRIAQSAGMSGPALQAVIAALKDGDTSNLPDVLRRTREELQAMAEDERLINLADGMANAFGDFFRSMVSGSESFREALGNLLKRIGDLILELLVIQPLIESLKNSFRGAFGGGGGGGINYGALSSTGMYLFDGGGNISTGGDVTPYGPRTKRIGSGWIADSGLGPRNFPAILEEGETVLTKDMMDRTARTIQGLAATQGGGGGVHVDATATIDARGADPAAIARLEDALRRRDAELPGRIIAGVRKAQQSNVKLG